jgi:SMC interacting uncharacterized protein involved in chromosome segregation
MKENKISKIYLGDYSSDGYDIGIDDGKINNSKNKFQFFKVVNPLNYVWNFDNSYKSFIKNYDKGYLDGQRVKNEVYSSNKKGVSMTDNYENHRRMLEVFESNLIKLQSYSQDIKEKYAKQLLAMESSGFVGNITNPLQQKYQKFSSKINDINTMIEEHKRKINILKESLDYLSQTGREN